MLPRIYIDGLTEDNFGTIAALLEPFGRVVSVRFPVNLATLKATDAIVELESGDAAARAADRLNGFEIDGRRLLVTQQREYQPAPFPPKQTARWADRHGEPELDLEWASSGILLVTAEVNRELIEQLARNPDLLRSTHISSHRFEEIVAELWRGFGYDVELTKQTRDGGYDIVAVRAAHVHEKYLIECKRPIGQKPVGVAVVRHLYGVLKAEEATKGIIATTASLSRDATIFVRDHQWVLDARDFHGIYTWIQEYLRRRGGRTAG